MLIAFCFGAFLEGSAGFGAPVAITAGMLVGLGFESLYAAGVCLIANTAPVAFGGIGRVASAVYSPVRAAAGSGVAGKALDVGARILPYALGGMYAADIAARSTEGGVSYSSVGTAFIC